MKILKIALLTVTILLMILIFYFSSQPADDSTKVSNHVGEFFCRLFIPDFNEKPAEEQIELIASIDHTVRKCAHAGEYMLLGILCSTTLLVWFSKKRSLLILSGWMIAVIYAVSDEVHQIFVPGRAFMVTDILIDSAGALIGVLIVAVVVRESRRRS